MSIPPYIVGVLLLAVLWLRKLQLVHPSATEILEATGFSRSQGYRLRGRLQLKLPDLFPKPGRPTSQSQPSPMPEISAELLKFLYKHPGAVCQGPQKTHYSDSFRWKLLDLHERHPDIPLADLAYAATIPLETLKSWLRRPRPEKPSPKPAPKLKAERPDVETVLLAYRQWDGTFEAFCKHLRRHWRVPFGRDTVRHILDVFQVRKPRQRKRAPDLKALKESFEVFYPPAQWVGDGTQVTVTLWGHSVTCNLQLLVDAYSAAFVGYSIRPTEDSQAVVKAFENAEQTTQASPIALLLDNKACNFTEEVKETLGATLLIPATPGRPRTRLMSKAPSVSSHRSHLRFS